jgi:histidinol-phosphatase (PHP family)
MHEHELEIYTGLEADYIPKSSENFATLKEYLKLDYVIGSVHLVVKGEDQENLWFIDGPKSEIYDEGINKVFGGNAKEAVKAYWHQLNMMIEKESFDIVGHLDKIKMHNKNRFFCESDTWYQALVNETLSLISQKDFLVEINTRGLYKKRSDSLFPGIEIINMMKKRNINVVLSSDAHQPNEISLYFKEAVETLKQCGYKAYYIYSSSKWLEMQL